MTDTLHDVNGPGSGPAGRRLLAELDRLTSTTSPTLAAELLPRGLVRLGKRSKPYQAATLDRLAEAGLLRSRVGRGPARTTVTLSLTAAGRRLLGK